MKDNKPIGDIVDQFVYDFAGDLDYISLMHRKCAKDKGLRIKDDTVVSEEDVAGGEVCAACGHPGEEHDPEACLHPNCTCAKFVTRTAIDEANEPRIPDLRQDYDEKAEVLDGTLYRKGTTIQVWWTHDVKGNRLTPSVRETWQTPDLTNAKRNFKDMKVRFNEEMDESQQLSTMPPVNEMLPEPGELNPVKETADAAVAISKNESVMRKRFGTVVLDMLGEDAPPKSKIKKYPVTMNGKTIYVTVPPREEDEVDEHIVKHGSGYRLVSHKGKNLGDFSSKAAAGKHEGEVEWFKKHKG
jgi:hypothetical protein